MGTREREERLGEHQRQRMIDKVSDSVLHQVATLLLVGFEDRLVTEVLPLVEGRVFDTFGDRVHARVVDRFPPGLEVSSNRYSK
jgi:hypothetical protein